MPLQYQSLANLVWAKAPVEKNEAGGATGVLLQYMSAKDSDGHFVVRDIPAAVKQSTQFLARQPLCSEKPLLNTSYPHVPISRRADYVLREREFGSTPDATGPVVWSNEQFVLRRLRAGIGPFRENCSREMVQTINAISVTGRAS